MQQAVQLKLTWHELQDAQHRSVAFILFSPSHAITFCHWCSGSWLLAIPSAQKPTIQDARLMVVRLLFLTRLWDC
jgi:hypothetical protein